MKQNTVNAPLDDDFQELKDFVDNDDDDDDPVAKSVNGYSHLQKKTN